MAERKTAIARETKIGLFVIAVLLVVFAVVIVRRLRQPTAPDETIVATTPTSDDSEKQPEAVVVAGVTGEQAPPSTIATEYDAQPQSHSHAGWNRSHYREATADNSGHRSSDRYAFMPAKPDSSADQRGLQHANESHLRLRSEPPIEDSHEDLAPTPNDGALVPTPTEVRVAQNGQFNPTTQQVQMLEAEDESSQPSAPPEFSAQQQMEPVTGHTTDASPAHPSRYGGSHHRHNHMHQRSPSPTPMYTQPANDVAQYTPPAVPHVAVTRPVSDRPLSDLRQIDNAVGNYLPQPRDGTYIVKPNDNFWTISEALYGSGNYFKALIAYNRQRHPLPGRLGVGDEVLAPSKAELMELHPDLCPKQRKQLSAYGISAPPRGDGREYVVQEGDTLFDIARYELGDPSRWVEIYKLNAHQLTEDFDFVRPGTKLTLPVRSKRQATDRVTRQPDAVSPQR